MCLNIATFDMIQTFQNRLAGSLIEALGAGKVVIAVPSSLLMHNHQVLLLRIK